MILVDSSVWIDYFNGARTRETDLLDGFLGARRIMTGDLIYAEVLRGFRSERHWNQAKSDLDKFPFAPMVGRDVAIASARNYRALRAAGITVRKTIDVLIATFCIRNGHDLLHSDRDFDAMVRPLGLRVV